MADEDHGPTTLNWNSIISSVSSLVAPVSVVTALLVFAAWTRTRTYFEYFGVDTRILGFSVQDYLLRSADTAFGILIWLAAGGMTALLVLLLGNRLAKNVAETDRKRLRSVVAWFAIACILFGLLSTLWTALALAITPYGVCAILIGGSLVLFRARCGLGFAKRSFADYLTRAILVLIIASACFWATTLYAQQLGTIEAEGVDRNPNNLAEVDLFSGQALDLPGDLIAPSANNLTPTKAAYRYVGLRLLEYSNSRWLLITGHRPGLRASVLVIKDSDDIHVEITQPPQ